MVCVRLAFAQAVRNFLNKLLVCFECTRLFVYNNILLCFRFKKEE